jgi:hypothetical protein
MAGGLQAPEQEEEEQQAQSSNQGVVFVLEDAQLETAMVGKARLVSALPLACCTSDRQ